MMNKAGSDTGRAASTGRFTTKTKSAMAAANAVTVLREGRAARVASALSQANRKTGLLTGKTMTKSPKK
jgi:hypothetical protein